MPEYRRLRQRTPGLLGSPTASLQGLQGDSSGRALGNRELPKLCLPSTQHPGDSLGLVGQPRRPITSVRRNLRRPYVICGRADPAIGSGASHSSPLRPLEGSIDPPPP